MAHSVCGRTVRSGARFEPEAYGPNFLPIPTVFEIAMAEIQAIVAPADVGVAVASGDVQNPVDVDAPEEPAQDGQARNRDGLTAEQRDFLQSMQPTLDPKDVGVRWTAGIP